MTLGGKTLKLCNCNGTMELDAKALARVLKLSTPVTIHTGLCRLEAGAFNDAVRGGECLVACTQEAPLFAELAEQAGAKAELKFVNIRETAGWSKEARQATPKIAALLALAALPEAEPVPGIIVSGLRPHSTRSGEVYFAVDAFSTDNPFDPRRAEARSSIPVWVWVMSLFVVAWAVWYAARMWDVPEQFA